MTRIPTTSIKASLIKYRQQLSYLFFGVLTTLVNYGVFWLFQRAWQGRWLLFANLLTFLVATAFAYITNKVFVFRCWGVCSPLAWKSWACI